MSKNPHLKGKCFFLYLFSELLFECFNNILNFQESPVYQKPQSQPDVSPKAIVLDAAELGDLPARYTICSLQPHQFPVVGVYVDKRVIPGFKYRVRPLPSVGKSSTTYPCLFGGKALTLQSIGKGYARRFTFEADPNHLNDNANYFWSDNRPEGFAFELEIISDGDKFTIYDANHEPQGTVEVLKIEVSSLAFIAFLNRLLRPFVGIRSPLPLLDASIMLITTGFQYHRSVLT